MLDLKKPQEKINKYFENFSKFLDISNKKYTKPMGFINELAPAYMKIIQSPPFEQINNSLVMNLVNYMIRSNDLKEIAHGSLDTLAIQIACNEANELESSLKEAYVDSFFLRSIIQSNPALKEKYEDLLEIFPSFQKDFNIFTEHLKKIEESFLLDDSSIHRLKFSSLTQIRQLNESFDKLYDLILLLDQIKAKGLFNKELQEDWSRYLKNPENIDKDCLIDQRRFLLKVLGLKYRNPILDIKTETIEELKYWFDIEIDKLEGDNYEKNRLLRRDGFRLLKVS